MISLHFKERITQTWKVHKKKLREICPYSCEWNNTDQQSPASGNITCNGPAILQWRRADVSKHWHSAYARKLTSGSLQTQKYDFSMKGQYQRITLLLSTGQLFHSSFNNAVSIKRLCLAKRIPEGL